MEILVFKSDLQGSSNEESFRPLFKLIQSVLAGWNYKFSRSLKVTVV